MVRNCQQLDAAPKRWFARAAPAIARRVGVLRERLCFASVFHAVSIALLGLVVTASTAMAQQRGGAADESQPASSGDWLEVLSKGTLDTQARIWARSEDGTLVLIPNSTLEEIVALRQQATGDDRASALPNYNIDSIVVTADARQPVVDMTSRFELTVRTEEAVAEVDLGLRSCRLTRTPEVTGPHTQAAFRVLPETGGYQWLLIGPPGSEHSIELKGKCLLDEDADRRTLNVNLPDAPCTLELALPPEAADLRTRAGDVLESQTTDGKTVATIVSRGGDVSVSWRVGGADSSVAAVEAQSQTVFEIGDPQLNWKATTELELRWYGTDATSELRLSLPTGARLRSMPPSDFERYRVARSRPPVVENEASRQADQDDASKPVREQLLIENFDLEQTRSLSLTLEWEWTPELSEATDFSVSAQIPALEVLGVDSHRGTIDCELPALYAVVFEEMSGVSLVQQVRMDDAFGGKRLRFEFERQSFDLLVDLRREQSLPIVRPTYHVHVDEHKLTLNAWLDCSFDPSQLQREIGLIMPDSWSVQENTAVTVPDPDRAFDDLGEPLRVRRSENNDGIYIITSPNVDSGNSNGNRRVRQVWRLIAEQDWSPGDGNALQFAIPEIIRGRLDGSPLVAPGSGALLVSGADNILLQDERSTGLLADSFSPEYEKLVRSSSVRVPLVFRFQSQNTVPYWAGTAELLPRQLSVEHRADLKLLSIRVDIQQMFDLQVANEALTGLRFAVRQDADDFQPPQVYVNGNLAYAEPVRMLPEVELEKFDSRLATLDSNAEGRSMERTSQSAAPSNASDSSSKTWRIYQLVGAPDLLGGERLMIRTSLPWDKLQTFARGTQQSTADAPGGGSTGTLRVPLVRLILPENTLQLSDVWQLTADDRIQAQPLDQPTIVSAKSGDASSPTYQLTPTQLEVPLQLRMETATGGTTIRIGRSWQQTAITSEQRRDRFVAQVSGAANELRLRLPKFITKTMVVVDGQVQEGYRYDNNSDTLVIDLADVSKRFHVVEVSYFLQESLSWVTQVDARTPQIVGAEASDVFFWELVTPPVQHLAWSPAKLTADWNWKWGTLWWYRDSSDLQLEDTLGATKQARLPAAANRYLMSGQLSETPTSTWVLSRFALWFPVGALSIAFTFIILNYSVFRSATAVVLYAVALAGLASIWPDFAMLVGQTALISLSLVALVLTTQVAIDSRVHRRSVFSNRPFSNYDSQVLVQGSRATATRQTSGRSAATGPVEAVEDPSGSRAGPLSAGRSENRGNTATSAGDSQGRPLGRDYDSPIGSTHRPMSIPTEDSSKGRSIADESPDVSRNEFPNENGNFGGDASGGKHRGQSSAARPRGDGGSSVATGGGS